MTKDDLKYGNVVELRNKAVYLYNLTETPLLSFNGEEGKDTSQYKNDLTFINNTYPELDIVKVYKDFTCQELLWERKEKPKLTEEERIILKNINEHFEYIARNEDNRLYLYEKKPRKIDYGWQMNDDKAYFVDFYMYDNLFQFIQWGDEEPYLIEDLLKEEDDE